MKKSNLQYLKWGFILICFDIKIGRLGLLPSFIGWICLLAALKDERTENEKRLLPFLYILILDSFWHWLLELTGGLSLPFDFTCSLEQLFITVIRVYTVYVLIGELRSRIGGIQPETEGLLLKCRIFYVVLQSAWHLAGVLEIMLIPLVIADCIWLVFMLKALWGIEPAEGLHYE